MEVQAHMKKVQSLSAMASKLGAAALLIAGCRESTQRQTDIPRLAPGVIVQDVSFFSVALNREMTYRVFLPKKLAPGKKLPVVYLLHGMGDDFKSWSNNTDVARYATEALHGGLILVMPEGASSFYMNAAGKPRDRYEDYLAEDLIRDVEARFPAEKGRTHRAVVGISMGGFAAVKLALSRPELFVFAGGLSPAIDVTRRGFTFRRGGQWWRFREIFGATGSKTRNSSDPFLLARSASPADTPYLFLAVGEQEPLLEPNLRFASLLSERHFSFSMHRMPGGHDWNEWNAQLPGCFDCLFKHLGLAG